MVPTSPRLGDFDWGCVYASRPVILPDEIRIYYGGSDGFHFGVRKGFFALATPRPDGFAGLTPSPAGATATILTVPVPVSAADKLRVTADLQAGGSLEISWRDPSRPDAQGRSVTLKGPLVLTDHVVTSERPNVATGQALQLNFALKGGTVYSFSLK